MTWLIARQYIPEFMAPLLMVVYAPIGLIAVNSEWCTAALEQYLRFWEPFDQGP